MKRLDLKSLTTDELVQRFVEIALAQDQALLYDEYSKYNRLYDRMNEVEDELRARGSSARRALLPLFNHSNAQVRLKAAIATLAVASDVARQTLQKISDRQEYPQAADARGMMRAVDEGRFTPK